MSLRRLKLWLEGGELRACVGTDCLPLPSVAVRCGRTRTSAQTRSDRTRATTREEQHRTMGTNNEWPTSATRPRERSPRPTRIPTWATTGARMTDAEKTRMVEDWRREVGDDALTSSGLGVFIRVNGVLFQKGFLGSKFLAGTPYKLTPDGMWVVPRERDPG